MDFQLTDEQAAIREAASRGEAGRVIAYAGTGKTSTLRVIAEARPRDRVLYLAFNKAIAQEAQEKMPAHVQARTTHSLAYDGTKAWRGARPLVNSWWRLKGDILRADSEAVEACRIYGRSLDHAFSAVAATLSRFCNSADQAPSPHHVPRAVLDPVLAAAYRLEGAPTTDSAEQRLEEGVRRVLAQGAARVWEALLHHNDWPVTHDAYLKVWQLSHPRLPADWVLFDEAQDAAPVQRDVVLRQCGTVWMVGDPHQAIYEWRGAIDALSHYPAPAYPLSRSWRFGPAIADAAGAILDLWTVVPQLSGGGGPGAVLGEGLQDSDYAGVGERSRSAVLCRTNMGVLTQALASLDAGRAVAVTGGGESLAESLESAVALYYGGRARHPDLRDFGGWQELELFSEAPGGEAWRPIVRRVREGADKASRDAMRLRRELVPESSASLVVSTAHRAKGRQWPWVTLGPDWTTFRRETGEVNETLARLWYVAMTRAETVLDLRAALGPWTDNWTTDTDSDT